MKESSRGCDSTKLAVEQCASVSVTLLCRDGIEKLTAAARRHFDLGMGCFGG
jgi:hypothetical protein